MRVVAGCAGRMPLVVPKGLDVRPTMDKVRAAIFDSLYSEVNSAHVADLFAGSGALGIEALSRGAAVADFVDSDQRAVDCIEHNLKTTGLSGNSRIFHCTVHSFIKKLIAEGKKYHLIFADPPYAKGSGSDERICALLSGEGVARILTQPGILILECSSSSKELPELQNWTVLRDKTYGRTRVMMLLPPAYAEDGETGNITG